MRATMRTSIAAILIAGTIACSGESTGPGGIDNDLTGTYSLQTINGSPVPVVVFQLPGFSLTVMSGTVTLNSGGSFTGVLTYRQVDGQQTATITETCTGTYTVNGNSVTFSEGVSTGTDCGGTYNGTWDGDDRLTVAYDATLQAVFEK